MRRRVREHAGHVAPPLPLLRFRGSTNREALAWVCEREAWWDATRNPDDSGWLPWLLEGWEQVGDLAWCGSIGAPCGDGDCMCALWPEHLSPNEDPISGRMPL